MRDIPAPLQVRLDSGATTLARCWIVTRADGVRMGFTEHDADISVDSVICRAGTGFAASEATSRYGLAIDGSEVSGALAAESLTESDLAAGRFDAARIATWLVDWSNPTLAVRLAAGTLGEVRRENGAFTAELRGIADRLAQESGRTYTARCGADLGDARCRVDLGLTAWRGVGAVAGLDNATTMTASGLAAFAAGHFTAGRIVWSSGANAGLAMEVKEHRVAGSVVRLLLWETMAEPIAVGDAFSVAAGCDKQFATCRDRFGNGVNFRGFPHIPGNDFVMRYARAGEGGTGLSLQDR